MSGLTTVSIPVVTNLVMRAFMNAGIPESDALNVAESLVKSESEGHPSHGLLRVSQIITRVSQGLINPRPDLQVLQDFGAVASIDGDHGLGQVIARSAMEIAIAKAKSFGIGAVSVRNSTHFGRSSHHAEIAATHGLVGLSATNASPRVVPGPRIRPVVGNNPWALAWPSLDSVHCLDICTSIAAAGKIRKAADTGEAIPDGWALDEDGAPTTDPHAALSGALLAIGGHKGWGISVVVDVLTGGLANGSMGVDVGGVDDLSRRQHSSHLLLAIDPRAFSNDAMFETRMTAYATKLRECGGETVRLPGQRSTENLQRAISDGLCVPEHILKRLEALAESRDDH